MHDSRLVLGDLPVRPPPLLAGAGAEGGDERLAADMVPGDDQCVAGCEATRGTTRTGPTRTGNSLPPASWRPPSSKECCAASTPSLAAVNVPNAGYVPGLPEGAVVEVPARADAGGLHPAGMAPLPEGILGPLRIQTINRLPVDAFANGCRRPLLQALLLGPDHALIPGGGSHHRRDVPSPAGRPAPHGVVAGREQRRTLIDPDSPNGDTW